MTAETPRDGAESLWGNRDTTGGSVSGAVSSPVGSVCGGSEELERESIDYFVSFVQMFGLQKSIGQIYGLLFVSVDSLAMDDIVARLGISKGSVSQGLTALKGLGAVTSHSVPDDRREHFQADLNVSRIVTHFFEDRLQPLLEGGEGQVRSMLRLAREGGPAHELAEVVMRLEALRKWQQRGRGILPLITKWLRR
ncbi:MAG: hypothetical protein GXX91_15705 [Verrucomicrobiaceae bacterium]|nr:hypothetical protein [Verrucomicrobiaceae bacterium]